MRFRGFSFAILIAIIGLALSFTLSGGHAGFLFFPLIF
jgi:hypothetical protein